MRVLELGNGVSSAFAARMFGDQGGDVIKVEGPEGDAARQRGPYPKGALDPERSGLFLALNTNKRGVCLDLDTVTGRASLLPLLDWADVLIHSFPQSRAEALGLVRAPAIARPAVTRLEHTKKQGRTRETDRQREKDDGGPRTRRKRSADTFRK